MSQIEAKYLAPSVTTKIEEVTKGVATSEKMIKILHGKHTFSQEYNHNTTVNIAALPANARIKSIELRADEAQFSWLYEDEINGPMSTQVGFRLGTVGTPNVFSNADLQNMVINNMAYTPWRSLHWYKEALATSLMLTFVDEHTFIDGPTIGLTGKILEYWIEYIQE